MSGKHFRRWLIGITNFNNEAQRSQLNLSLIRYLKCTRAKVKIWVFVISKSIAFLLKLRTESEPGSHSSAPPKVWRVITDRNAPCLSVHKSCSYFLPWDTTFLSKEKLHLFSEATVLPLWHVKEDRLGEGSSYNPVWHWNSLLMGNRT